MTEKKNNYILLTVFISGMTTLGVELSAIRLIAPFFGTSDIIWANLIGLVLIYLSIGYFVGGRWADTDPRHSTFYQIIAWGAFLTGLIPFVAMPILRWSVEGFATFNAGILIGSFVAVLILFSIPMTLLGMASPFAIRLAVTNVGGTGKIAGSIYALSTLGSILGTFLPGLILIPNIGTRYTFLFFSIVLLIVAIGGLLSQSKSYGVIYLCLMVILIILAIYFPNRPIKINERAVYETESRYNYIQVIKANDEYLLYLNEGTGIHSIYRPHAILAYGIWDYFLIVPFFNDPPHTTEHVNSLLVIGSAAGTISKQYTAVYGKIPIDGVEIDPEISRVGYDWFAMNEPNVTTINEDGRFYLANIDRKYDVISVDAYRPPYIPFQLTSQEFFQEIYDHLNDDGIVAINAGRSAHDYSLVIALGSTMKSVFPNVYVLDAPSFESDLGNSLVIASKQPTKLLNVVNNAALVENPHLHDVFNRVINFSRVWEITCQANHPFVPGFGGDLLDVLPSACIPPFTDDKAPIEQVVHGLIFRYILNQ
ncbi:MAG: hypothetical protein B6242_05970 [Anaerolineaceae bacterium 4572_78]|nr:MAG: hypothetical protein B6242_05970 [Anaerolineaceae bacterium 4572_78]